MLYTDFCTGSCIHLGSPCQGAEVGLLLSLVHPTVVVPVLPATDCVVLARASAISMHASFLLHASFVQWLAGMHLDYTHEPRN